MVFTFRLGARDDAGAALGEAGHGIDGRAAGTAGDGGLQRAGADIDLAGDDGGLDVQALGEHPLLDLQAVFRP
ncbi:MAG: hypothetical protein NVV74_18740 [Magnetospirillum sp.]|nr:hypothetical protein [Magnetospirillum sp.]